MKHTYKYPLIISVFAIIALFLPFLSVKAAVTPTFALANGNNSIVSISLNADPNAQVLLYYYPNNASNPSSTNIGTTDSSGNLNTTLNSYNYSIPSGSSVYVIVNGQQSQAKTWPNYSNNGNSNGGNVYLSQNNININSLGSATVNVNGGNGNGYYISSNSNSGAVSAYVSGNTINLSANSSGGSSTITVCANSSGYGCATLYVTINGNGNNNYNSNPITINPSSISLTVGQSANVSIYGGNNVYYTSNGTDSYVVNASINGNTINLYARNPGSATITVCSSNVSSGNNYNYSSCANLYVTVGNGNYYYGNNTNTTYYNTPSIGTSASGVYLSQIPYTGVEENLKMIFFILGMMIWSAFMAYALMLKRGMLQPAGHPKMSMKERIEEFKKENLRRKGVR
ncbi:MAG: hypothetical protein JWP09_619 [Candidatus Taylorbacteria bacterium]|nr:hypothetical protein [Candidatus Taylorbacteria bacterium]